MTPWLRLLAFGCFIQKTHQRSATDFPFSINPNSHFQPTFYQAALGLHFHTTIAVQLDGVASGLLHQSFWSRPPEAEPKAHGHKAIPIEDKESYKWLEGIEAAEAALDSLPAEQRPRLLHIFDREGDIHEVLQRITDSPHGGVIRAAQNRSVAGTINKAFASIAAAPLVGVKVIEVPARRGTKKRRATLELRSVSLTITPNTQYHARQPVTWTLVEAREQQQSNRFP